MNDPLHCEALCLLLLEKGTGSWHHMVASDCGMKKDEQVLR